MSRYDNLLQTAALALSPDVLSLQFMLRIWMKLGIFHRLIASGRTIILGLTQPLTETSTRGISWRLKVAGG